MAEQTLTFGGMWLLAGAVSPASEISSLSTSQASLTAPGKIRPLGLCHALGLVGWRCARALSAAACACTSPPRACSGAVGHLVNGKISRRRFTAKDDIGSWLRNTFAIYPWDLPIMVASWHCDQPCRRRKNSISSPTARGAAS
jgi:hypothetical protein